MNKLSLKLYIASLVTCCLLSVTNLSVSASEKFIAPVFPVRGAEFGALTGPDHYQQFLQLKDYTDTHQVRATWMFRYDALTDPRITTTARLFPTAYERALFLEITPSLAKEAEVEYPQGESWHEPQRVFISGYSLIDRYKLIDTLMNKFLKDFGAFPKSVGAWHIDAESARYMSQKYGVTGITIVADQYSTDHYQIWGTWWGVPYYPSTYNILTPAQTLSNKLPVVTTQWAARDPVLGYGQDAFSSIYSVQANDYMQYKLDIDYFQHLAEIYLDSPDNPYGFLLIGIENDYPLSIYGPQVNKQLAYAAQRTAQDQSQTVTLSEFSQWYQSTFPQLSPDHTITGTSPEGHTTTWSMSTKIRQGTRDNQLIDYRVYNEKIPEPFLLNKNIYKDLYLTVTASTDTLTIPANYSHTSAPAQQLLQSPKTITISVTVLLILGFLMLMRQQLNPALLTIIGSFIWCGTMVKSGLNYPSGISFWGPHGHDGIWHLAIIEHFSRSFSLDNPILADTRLSNYHFLYDILVSVVHRLTGIPNSALYFQVMPLILSLGIGYTLWKFVTELTHSKKATTLSLILMYIAGSAGWIVTYYRDKTFSGETMFWAQQSISTLINPPFALSLTILCLGFYFLLRYLAQPTAKLLIITSFIFTLLAPTKIYASILLLLSLTVLSLIKESLQLIKLCKNKQILSAKILVSNIPLLSLTLITGLTSIAITLPFTSTDQSPFIFHPWWFINTMLISTDRFHWPQLANAIQAYSATDQTLKLLAAQFLGLVIFIAGNFFLRLIGLGYICLRILKVKSDIASPTPQSTLIQLLVIFTFFAISIPLLFIQSATDWNTIQFLYYGLFIANIFTAIAIQKYLDYNIPKSKMVITSFVILTLLIMLSVPTTIGTLKHYLPSRAPSRIPIEELLALSFLQTQAPGTILTYPFEQARFDLYDEPRPLQAYTSTAYVAAYSGHPVVLEDQINLNIIGAPWELRRLQILHFFKTQDAEFLQNFIKQHQIKYLYLLSHQLPAYDPKNLGFQKIFDNGLVLIYAQQ